jgi:hypothetical protein
MGIDHEKAWAEFEEVAGRLKENGTEFMTWEDADA